MVIYLSVIRFFPTRVDLRCGWIDHVSLNFSSQPLISCEALISTWMLRGHLSSMDVVYYLKSTFFKCSAALSVMSHNNAQPFVDTDEICGIRVKIYFIKKKS